MSGTAPAVRIPTAPLLAFWVAHPVKITAAINVVRNSTAFFMIRYFVGPRAVNTIVGFDQKRNAGYYGGRQGARPADRTTLDSRMPQLNSNLNCPCFIQLVGGAEGLGRVQRVCMKPLPPFMHTRWVECLRPCDFSGPKAEDRPFGCW